VIKNFFKKILALILILIGIATTPLIIGIYMILMGTSLWDE
jgi:uncharacterized membrane protein